MMLPEFNHTNAKWDEFRAFHIKYAPRGAYSSKSAWVQFDTGEMICTSAYFDPDDRGHIKALGLSVHAIDDKNCPPVKTVDNTPVKKTWLTRGAQQMLLFDHNTGLVVALSKHTYDRDRREMCGLLADIPFRLQKHAHAYFAGHQALPIGAPVMLYLAQQFTPEQREHLQGLVAASKAWDAFERAENPVHSAKVPFDLTKPMSPTPLLNMTFDQLDTVARARLVRWGLKTDYAPTPHQYLRFDP